MRRTLHGKPTLAEERPRPRRGRGITSFVLAGLVVAVGAGGWVAVQKVREAVTQPDCQATALGNEVSFTPAQMNHAATIVGVAMKRDLPARAATIALATAIQESKLRNLTYGDRDSLGLFQQRPSQGWGTEKQLLDPVYATNKFYDALVKIEGYQSMEITKIAQKVQRSAYPEAYADHEQEGRILASALSGYSPGGLGCRLDKVSGTTDADAFGSQLERQLGLSVTQRGRTLVVQAGGTREAWGVAAWAVAKAEEHQVTRVQVGDRVWTRGKARDAAEWQPADDLLPGTRVTVALS